MYLIEFREFAKMHVPASEIHCLWPRGAAVVENVFLLLVLYNLSFNGGSDTQNAWQRCHHTVKQNSVCERRRANKQTERQQQKMQRKKAKQRILLPTNNNNNNPYKHALHWSTHTHVAKLCILLEMPWMWVVFLTKSRQFLLHLLGWERIYDLLLPKFLEGVIYYP